MKSIVVSDFKARCLAVLREAQETGEAVLVTRYGQPLARIEPVPEEPAARRLGTYRGRMKIREGFDLVHTGFADDWEIEH